GVLCTRAAGDAVFARAGRVYKFDLDVRTYSLDVAIPPYFEGIGRRRAAAFPGGAVVAAARGVRFDLIRLAEHDIDAPAVGLPPGDAAGVMLVGVGDALVMLFAVFVDVGVGVGIAAENLALVRKLTHNLLQQETTLKRGIQTKRLKAGWDRSYLLKILNVKPSNS